MSKSYELTSEVVEYLTILLTTCLLWGRDVHTANGLLRSTGDTLIGDIYVTDGNF